MTSTSAFGIDACFCFSLHLLIEVFHTIVTNIHFYFFQFLHLFSTSYGTTFVATRVKIDKSTMHHGKKLKRSFFVNFHVASSYMFLQAFRPFYLPHHVTANCSDFWNTHGRSCDGDGRSELEMGEVHATALKIAAEKWHKGPMHL